MADMADIFQPNSAKGLRVMVVKRCTTDCDRLRQASRNGFLVSLAVELHSEPVASVSCSSDSSDSSDSVTVSSSAQLSRVASSSLPSRHEVQEAKKSQILELEQAVASVFPWHSRTSKNKLSKHPSL